MNYWKKRRLEQKKLMEDLHLSQQLSSYEEDAMGIPHRSAISEKQLKKKWDESSVRQRVKDEQNSLLWEEEYKKRRAWEEEHWVETEGGNGYYRPGE